MAGRGEYYQGVSRPGGGIKIPQSNPFQMAAQSVGGSGLPPMQGGMGSAPMATSTRPTSRIPQGRSYNPMTDPEGPLARSGWIGAMLFGNGMSRSEHLLSMEEQRKQEVGLARGKAFQSLANLVQQGNSPQQALMKFVNTPEGMDFMISDPSPEDAIGQFIKLVQTDPTAQARADVFGGAAAGGMAPPSATTPPGEQPVTAEAAPPGAAEQGTVPAIGSPLPQGIDSNTLRAGAAKLAAIGDNEGARLALSLAEQYDKIDTPQDLVVVPDDTSVTGARLVTKEEARNLPAFPPKPLVTLEDKRDGKTEEALAAYNVKRLETEIDEPAKASREVLPNIQAFRSALGSGQFEPGAAGEFRKTASQWADLLGIDPSTPAMKWLGLGEPASAETMEGAANLIAETMSGSMSRVSNLSINLLKQAGPSLLKTREGNELMLTLLQTTAERNLQVAQYKERFIADAYNRGETPNFPQMFQEIEQLREAWAPIDKEMEAHIKKLEKEGNKTTFGNMSKADAEAAAKANEAPTFKTLGEAQKSMSGKPPGRYRVVIDGRPGTLVVTE